MEFQFISSGSAIWDIIAYACEDKRALKLHFTYSFELQILKYLRRVLENIEQKAEGICTAQFLRVSSLLIIMWLAYVTNMMRLVIRPTTAL